MINLEGTYRRRGKKKGLLEIRSGRAKYIVNIRHNRKS